MIGFMFGPCDCCGGAPPKLDFPWAETISLGVADNLEPAGYFVVFPPLVTFGPIVNAGANAGPARPYLTDPTQPPVQSNKLSFVSTLQTKAHDHLAKTLRYKLDLKVYPAFDVSDQFGQSIFLGYPFVPPISGGTLLTMSAWIFQDQYSPNVINEPSGLPNYKAFTQLRKRSSNPIPGVTDTIVRTVQLTFQAKEVAVSEIGTLYITQDKTPWSFKDLSRNDPNEMTFLDQGIYDICPVIVPEAFYEVACVISAPLDMRAGNYRDQGGQILSRSQIDIYKSA